MGGVEVEGRRAGRFESRNPARWSEVVATLPRGTEADVDAAVAAATAAAASWRRVPWPARGEVLLRAGLLLEQRREELARL
ncbi:MAG TPA: aldehyde dehydrogenase family protein, partial [Candidatus Dormibacteraeota bacterium]|nr:aldehyde dehydrogenase family protein [Candidatus Dormibacteraeota bacterium]